MIGTVENNSGSHIWLLYPLWTTRNQVSVQADGLMVPPNEFFFLNFTMVGMQHTFSKTLTWNFGLGYVDFGLRSFPGSDKHSRPLL